MQSPSSARETVRDLLVQALGALARDGIIPAVPAQRPDRAREARRARRLRVERRAGDREGRRASRRARWPRRSSRACRRARDSPLAEATIAGPGVHQPAPRARVLAAPAAARSSRRATTGGGAPRARRRRSSSSTCRRTRPARSPSRTGGTRAVGDSLTRLLRFAGYPVTPEYYINDAGNQVQMLTLSVWTRYMEAARAADPSRARGRVPRERLQGRLHPRLRPRSLRARRHALGRDGAARRRRADQAVRDRARAGDDPRDAGALRRRRSTSGRASARCTTRATSTRRCARSTPRATSIAATTPSG